MYVKDKTDDEKILLNIRNMLRLYNTGMLSATDQRGLEAKIFGLGLAASASSSSSWNDGLILTKVVLVASLSDIEITSFTLGLRSSLIGNCCLLCNNLLKLTFE